MSKKKITKKLRKELEWLAADTKHDPAIRERELVLTPRDARALLAALDQ